MTEAQVREFDEKAKISEEQTDQFEVVGEDGGEKRVLSSMNIVATNNVGQQLTKDQVVEIATKHFEKHCSQIGWWPSGEYPDVTVKRREDGSWFAVAFLKESTHNKVKSWEDFPHVGVDTRTAADVDSVV